MMNFRVLQMLMLLQALLALAVVALTNSEVPQRVQLLLFQNRLGALAVTGAFWVLALIGLVAIIVQRNSWVRLFWALVVGIGGSVAWGFQHAAKLELSIFDILSFWEARHEVGRAASLYGQSFIWAGFIAAIGVAAFGLPYISKGFNIRRFSAVVACVPFLPVVAIGALIYEKQGQGYFAMPKQFSQLSMAGLTAGTIVLNAPEPRHVLLLKPKAQKQSQKILLLVDESVRPDYLNTTAGNSVTPSFARFAAKMVDFGPAASGAVCSNYSNAILRFAAARADLGRAINSNPTIWQYAKAAGYRTVFIDAQAQNLKNSSQLQNFMTVDELRFVDQVYRLTDVEPQDADFRLLDILQKELTQAGPVFIYANKQGAHFPYGMNFNSDSARHVPVSMGNTPETMETLTNSYRNAIDRNVDQFFDAANVHLPLQDLSFVYTSDHGQFLQPGVATHCVASDAKPQMALVPLFAFSSDTKIAADLKLGAAKSFGKASHFQIAPTLMEWMGFGIEDVAKLHPESLTRGPAQKPAFSHGDVFGLFRSDIELENIDLKKDYLEHPEDSVAANSAATGRGDVQ
jgi:glucan phosphoethanolaminetransferase (alkaline phosphatase superfamily)